MLPNTVMVVNGTVAGSVASYECIEGSEDLDGGSGYQQVTCTIHGWQQPTLTCEGMD